MPRTDVLWEDDVVRGAFWFGDVWAKALTAVGLEPKVHRARATVTEWSALVCFAGVGPGEVTVDGKKVVGLSQRRSAAGARLQTVALLSWDPRRVLEVLDLPDADRARASAALVRSAEGLASLGPVPVDPSATSAPIDELWRVVVHNLPPA